MEAINPEESLDIIGGIGTVLRDPNGNIIFTPVGMLSIEHLSGSSGLFNAGYIYANDGTIILVYENTIGLGAGSGWNTICHGQTFLDGKYWMNYANMLISHDGYEEVAGNYNIGNVVVYYDSNGQSLHSATISSVSSGGAIVYGQGGLESSNSFSNIEFGYTNYSYYKVYSNSGDRQLTQAEYNNFVQNGYSF